MLIISGKRNEYQPTRHTMQVASLGYEGHACLGHVLATGQITLEIFRDMSRRLWVQVIPIQILNLLQNLLLNTSKKTVPGRQRDPNPRHRFGEPKGLQNPTRAPPFLPIFYECPRRDSNWGGKDALRCPSTPPQHTKVLRCRSASSVQF